MTTKDYHRFFDPQVYFNLYLRDPKQDQYFLAKLAEFWGQKQTYPLANLLNYGGGFNIATLITASKHVQNIVFAEYLPSNREAVVRWIDNDPRAFDWRPSFEYVVQHVEGRTVEDVVTRETELREKIKAVVPCDVKAANSLQIPSNISANYGPPFDVVVTCLCLEVAVDNEQEYKDHVSYLASLVRSGGSLVMLCVLGQSYYVVGDHKFYGFPLTKSIVLDSMESAGLKAIIMDVMNDDYCLSDSSGLCFVYGRA